MSKKERNTAVFSPSAVRTAESEKAMDILEIMRQRHSVRKYKDAPIPDTVRTELEDKVRSLNAKSGLDMQIFFDEPDCFKTNKTGYGRFFNVRNYLAIVGDRQPGLDETAGYYGERFVIFAQSLGLNTCWVGLSHSKTKAMIRPGQKLVIVIAFGYGAEEGVPHKGKKPEDLLEIPEELKNRQPEWLKRGMEAASLAPTAINQQKFRICFNGKELSARVKGFGFYAKVDLGIVKSDFEQASGHSFDR